MDTHYYQLPGGGVAFREVKDGDSPVVPEDWTEIDIDSYGQTLDAIEAADAAELEAKQVASTSARQGLYNRMKASNHFEDLTDEDLRLLSGYQGA